MTGRWLLAVVVAQAAAVGFLVGYAGGGLPVLAAVAAAVDVTGSVVLLARAEGAS